MFPYIHIFGVTVGSYGSLMLAAVFLVALLAILRAPTYGLVTEDVLIIGACACGVGLLTGNLVYIFVTYSPVQIAQLVQSGHITDLFSGIVYYGGLLGGIFGAWIGTRIAGCKLEAAVGTVVPYIPLGHSIGRIGCLMAGCCYGFAYDGPMAVYYPHSVAGLSPQQGYFPVQLLEGLCNIGIFLFLRQYEKKREKPCRILIAYLGLYACTRFVLEFLRGDQARGIYAGISASQWISIALAGVCAADCWRNRKKRKRA